MHTQKSSQSPSLDGEGLWRIGLEVSELSKSGQAWDTRTCWTEDRRDLACADHKCQIYKAVLSVSCRETDRLFQCSSLTRAHKSKSSLFSTKLTLECQPHQEVANPLPQPALHMWPELLHLLCLEGLFISACLDPVSTQMWHPACCSACVCMLLSEH
jgi:hypothetical protein